MRAAPEEPAEPPAEPEGPRDYRGPTAVRDEPGREATWVDPNPSPPEREPEPEDPALDAPSEVTPSPPPPSSVRDVPEHIAIAVGLAPEAPGSRDERALLDALEASASASVDPTVEVRRLRVGAGSPRRICREHRDDLVVMIGYVADREEPVVLAHDCRLDHALGVRASDAVREPELMAALWDEHLELARSGIRERRSMTPLGPRARGAIIGGVAVVVVGVAVGALVANALRKESVVITVRP
ncbi:MAG: hypothetical protein H6712_04345 [Myxococcales bacterium]|nr:hypothetical protein [Myxococcales bacterium]MCB9713059.1 hypothetical protein [Myxococcales bacterium]